MPSIQLTESTNLEDILLAAAEMNMTSVEALDFLARAIDIVKARNKRVFSFSDPVDPAQPAACRADFVRSFVHADWIDGESVVQAEDNTIEEGFNARFHKIEDDLDALAADIAQAFVCIGDQRAEIAKALDEVKAELNRINADIFECCGKSVGGTIDPGQWTGPSFPQYPRPLPYPLPEPLPGGPWGPVWPGVGPSVGPRGPWGPVEPRGPWVSPVDIVRQPGIGVGTPWGGDVEDPVRSYIDTIKGYQSWEGARATMVRSNSDPTRGVVAGMSARLIEENSFNGQPVEVWSTAAGIILVPAAEPGKATRAAWSNPRVDVTGRFARWAAANENVVRTKLGEVFTLADFVASFGEQKVEGGIRIADVVDRLATDLEGGSPLVFVAPLAEANGRAVVREGFASETVIGAIGLNPGAAGNVENASVTTMKSLDQALAANLARVGVRSVGALAAAAPVEVAEKLRNVGVQVAAADIAGFGAEAAAILAVDRFARGQGGIIGG